MVVDVQRGFLRPETQDLPALIEKQQQKYAHVAATRFSNPAGSFYRSLIGWERMGPDSPETALAFTPPADALVLPKTVYTCVTDSFLAWLAARRVRCVHLCGIDTDICVTKCAVDLFEKGIEPVVLADLCASSGGAAAHERGLAGLRRFIGAGQVRLSAAV